MTDQRLRDLLEERVADLTTVDLASGAWERASSVRRQRRAVAGVAASVVAVVAGTTLVVAGQGDQPAPPSSSSPTSVGPVVRAEKGGEYAGVPVWWAPSVADEADLPVLSGTALPAEVDLSAGAPPVPRDLRAVALFQLWGDEPGRVVVVGADGASYSLDVGFGPVEDGDGNESPPVTQESLSPNGRYAFFVQERSLEVYDFEEAVWTKIPTERFAAGSAEWTVSGEIQVPVLTSNASRNKLYRPTGEPAGTSIGRTGHVGPADADTPYGPTLWGPGGWAAGAVDLAGPIKRRDEVYRSVGAVNVIDSTLSGRPFSPGMVLAMPPEPGGGRWKQCCPVVGWLDNKTVLFESRHVDARILAWRIGTREVSRVADIRGWIAGDESYVASFAAVDGSVRSDSASSENQADAEVQDVPVWWSPDLATEPDLPLLESSIPGAIGLSELGNSTPPLAEEPLRRAVAAFWRPAVGQVIVGDSAGRLRAIDLIDAADPERDAAGYELPAPSHEMLAPDGTHLFLRQDGALLVIDVRTGATTRVDVEGHTTEFATWLDDRTVLLMSGDEPGPLYDVVSGRRLVADAGAAPVQIFSGRSAFFNRMGPWKVAFGKEAQTWEQGGPSLPVPDSARYLAGPAHLSVSGEWTGALAFVSEIDRAKRDPVRLPEYPVVAGWLDDSTVVYESRASDGRDLLIAWRIGTHAFFRVSEIEGSELASFADLSAPTD